MVQEDPIEAAETGPGFLIVLQQETSLTFAGSHGIGRAVSPLKAIEELSKDTAELIWRNHTNTDAARRSCVLFKCDDFLPEDEVFIFLGEPLEHRPSG